MIVYHIIDVQLDHVWPIDEDTSSKTPLAEILDDLGSEPDKLQHPLKSTEVRPLKSVHCKVVPPKL